MFAWLQSQIDKHGLRRVLWFPVEVVVAGAALAPLFAANVGAGFLATLSLVTVNAIVLLVVQVIQNRQLRSAQREMGRSLQTLRAHVAREIPAQAKNLFWRDHQGVKENGDTFQRAHQRLLIEGDRPLHFLPVEMKAEALKGREQRRVQVIARSEPGGARLPVDMDWPAAGWLKFWIHWESPIQPGEEVEFSYEFAWPHTLPGLAQGGVEHVQWTLERPTQHFEGIVRLDAKLRRTREIRITPHGIPFAAIKQGRDGDSWTISAAADDVPAGGKISLDLDAG